MDSGDWVGAYVEMMADLAQENEKLRLILSKLLPSSGHYFICGESGDKDTNGLPEGLIVCAAFGSDALYHYKRVDGNVPESD